MAEDSSTEEIIKIPTTRFGELEVKASSVITIVNGVIGFPDKTRYVLLDYNPPFSWLQSLDSPELAFVVVSGSEFGDDYHVGLPFGDRDLQLEKDDDVAIVNLVSVRSDPTMTTVNLKAPLIVNLKNMVGRQMVLDNPNYPVRMPLWAQDEGGGTEGGGE